MLNSSILLRGGGGDNDFYPSVVPYNVNVHETSFPVIETLKFNIDSYEHADTGDSFQITFSTSHRCFVSPIKQ